jgi:hypothetical protein
LQHVLVVRMQKLVQQLGDGLQAEIDQKSIIAFAREKTFDAFDNQIGTVKNFLNYIFDFEILRLRHILDDLEENGVQFRKVIMLLAQYES